ncbi:MAG: PEGA domain-containing protein [Terriglobales bacterium]
MRAVRTLIAVVLIYSTVAYAQGNSWHQVRYNGGTLQTKVDPHDWDNNLTVTSDQITFQLKDGQKVEIPTKDVTGLSYGQEAHRRVGTMVALGIIVAPVALFGLFHKTRLHYIGMEYSIDGKKGGLLLQGHKDNYRAILLALESTTHAPLSVSEKDREFVPATVQATVVKDSEGEVKTAAKKETGTLSLTSEPSGAEVYIDGEFAGNTPSKLTLDAGKHTVKVTAKDYKDWSREMTVREGSEMTVAAMLEK